LKIGLAIGKNRLNKIIRFVLDNSLQKCYVKGNSKQIKNSVARLIHFFRWRDDEPIAKIIHNELRRKLASGKRK